MKLWSHFTKVVSVAALLAVSVVAPALNAWAAGPAIAPTRVLCWPRRRAIRPT